MRIGIDARLWNETGVGRYIRSLVKYLQVLDKSNDYVLFCKSKDHESIKYQVLSIKWKIVETDIHWHTLREQLVLPWIFSKERLDLLHFPYFSFPIFYPGKFIITIHDLIYDHYKTGKASTLPAWLYLIKKIGYHLVLWIAVRRARAILTLSNDVKSEIVEHYGVDPLKITVTYEAGELENARRKFEGNEFSKIKKLRPYLLYLGNAHPHKNVEGLVLALKQIQRIRKDLKLILIGSDNFFYPKLKKYIKQQGLEKQILVVGTIPNAQITVWYRFAEALVTASKMEGFGIPPLEAMSLGCPAIVSDIPVFHEIYGDAAVYFDQNNLKAIAKVIVATLADKQLIQEKIKKGYQRVKMYSWQKTAQETLEVYQKT